MRPSSSGSTLQVARAEVGDSVIVETERGIEIGHVTSAPHEVERAALPAALKPVMRVAGTEDLEYQDELEVKERDAMPVFRQMVSEYKLDMKAIDVEYLFGGDKVVFYFVAEERIDFRDLVKDLAEPLPGAHRHASGRRSRRGADGGRPGPLRRTAVLRSFRWRFQPVSIRMAKEQDLPLNPLKISGLCGRLMCCLRYEYEAYKDFKSRAPRKGTIVETPLGLAKVSELHTPRETIGMKLEDGTRVTVPLAGMGCSKGTGCPCSVSQRFSRRQVAPPQHSPSRRSTAKKRPRQHRPRRHRSPVRAEATGAAGGEQRSWSPRKSEGSAEKSSGSFGWCCRWQHR